MYIKNNDGIYVKVRKRKSGSDSLTFVVDKEDATNFVTAAVFDVLERLNKFDSSKGWRCE